MIGLCNSAARGGISAIVAAASLALFSASAAWEPTKDDFVVVSTAASPRVAYALHRDDGILCAVVDVAPWNAEAPATRVDLGVSAARSVLLHQAGAPAQEMPAVGTVTRYRFNIPVSRLLDTPDDWARLRLGIGVRWGGGPLGADRQRERLLHVDGSPHRLISQNPADWQPLNLVGDEALVSDRRNRIVIRFNQPMDGKASIVVEDEAGNRIRNLVSGRPMSKGTHEIVWDGLDDEGNAVSPGTYTWRAISHPGITPQYLFSFCNDGTPPWRTGSGKDMWGPDHSNLVEAVAGSEWTFLAGNVAESGYAIVAVDARGVKQMHYNPVHGTGLGKVALATDDTYLYAAHDGMAWGQRIDKSKPDWKASYKLTITRFDIRSGRVVDFPGRRRTLLVDSVEFGPGSANPHASGMSLGGLEVLGGKLYVADHFRNRVVVLDAATGNRERELRLNAPGAIRKRGGQLLAVSGRSVVSLDPATGTTATVIREGAADPAGLAVGPDGSIFISDRSTHTVRVFDAAGRQVREIGKRGGPYKGAWDSERMVNPRGLAVSANGWLWVTEDRNTPKRVCAWDLNSGRIVKEKYGPTNYGASGAGFDSADHTRWIGQGTQWKLDFDKHTARPTSILGGLFGASNYEFVRKDGRTFLICFGGYTTISELLPDGTRKDLAMVASTHRFCFGMRWNPPPEFIEAFNRAYPNRIGKHSDKGPGVLWVDRNGDGRLQVDEFDFSTEADDFAGAYWGHDFYDLTIRVPARVGGKVRLVTLEPDGYYPGGAPRYPRLNDACKAGVPIDLAHNHLETSVDRFGNLVCNSDPRMKCFAPNGRLLWSFPNRWTGVHGSHNAPLPETGVMQGALYFLGMAPFDDKADVFIMNGNHGRFFVLTSDGIYLDEMFKDVRMGASVDAYLIGGECFGGFFGRADDDGNYYLQSGHTDYRIFRIDGLRQARRSSGTITVTPAQVVAAENAIKRVAAGASEAKRTRVPFAAPAPTIDGNPADWPPAPAVSWDKDGRFPVTVRLAWDDALLYLCYEVQDDSPWVNNGNDWTLLFKTGDCIDLQLGTDPAANPNRLKPVQGDLRLLIAPTDGKQQEPTAVLYRYVVPGTTEPVLFSSPWRNVKVDSVAILDTARIAVSKGPRSYCVEASIPLADLGMAPPAGTTLKADFGVIYGDPGGAIDMLRSYWSNKATGLVNDVPGETMLTPNLWGAAEFERRKQ